ncbi:DUF3310 domain-containing protein [Streptomyces misionensis]|uniref:DUF3310 domain-containing protein n=1 Tax=Streptomyces misionensis TaxID=67331 RepID=UPI00367C1490
MKYQAGDKVRILRGPWRGIRGEVYAAGSYVTAPYEYGVKFSYEGDVTYRAFNGNELAPDLAPVGSSEPEPDNVHHPSHYTWLPNGVEVIDITENLTNNLGNVVKYVLRAGRKSQKTHLEDLQKAAWYLQREINRVQKVGNK